jgi:glycosyltransferase involved in cell wall biosynthesis
MLPLFKELPGVTIHLVPYYHWLEPTFVLRLAGKLSMLKPRAILCYNFGKQSILSGAAACIAGIPCRSVHIGNLMPQEPKLQHRLKFYTRATTLLGMNMYPCSMAVLESLRKLGAPPSRLCVIYNGVNVKEIAARAENARRAMTAGDRKIVGMVARLDLTMKDQETLLKAFSLISRNSGSLELWIIGDGPDRPKLERYAQELGIGERVIFWGNRADVSELLGQMDLFAFSTRAVEGFGIAIAEAMAAGLPIVATDVPACREVLEEGERGILVPPGDAEAMAGALEGLLESLEKRDEMSVRALSRAHELSIERCAGKWHQALSDGGSQGDPI